jgi:hypothetical protein
MINPDLSLIIRLRIYYLVDQVNLLRLALQETDDEPVPASERPFNEDTGN